ncbi:MAG: cytochrome-c oxidase, cbb3-type subunit III [Alphaproteobacteria bacterium]|nr:cytochrome-c oxidase, cbb3-type subunit III [Alphaproteobacteria bacterium]
MPTKIEKDAVTGQDTTGHEWDGIKELNTPLPRWWLYVLYATILISIVYFVLYPAIPWGTGYTEGLLGHTERKALEKSMSELRASRAVYIDEIAKAPLDEIRARPELFKFAAAGGKSAFADNCAPCHAAGGAGRPGFPSLADDIWLWGGKLTEIEQTIRHGVRWEKDEDTRLSEMPRFGADKILATAEIEQLATYVLSLSGGGTASAGETTTAALYTEQCASCHGPAGQGNREFGAPRLADAVWLYGGSREAVARQIAAPRHGVMPAWGGRLDAATIKMLTLYVHSLGGGE